MSAAALIEAIQSKDPRRLFVARALHPDLRRKLSAAMQFTELPFVRGRTIVTDDVEREDLVVAGHPNYLGVFDSPSAVPWIALTGRWSMLKPVVGAVATVPLAAHAEPDLAGRVMADMLDLAKRVTHQKGVAVPFAPQSGVLVVLLAVDPAAVSSAIDMPGCTDLAGFEELPGGFRIEPPAAMLDAPLDGYAEAMKGAIDTIDVEQSNRWT